MDRHTRTSDYRSRRELVDELIQLYMEHRDWVDFDDILRRNRRTGSRRPDTFQGDFADNFTHGMEDLDLRMAIQEMKAAIWKAAFQKCGG